MGKLRDQMQGDMELRGFSKPTQKTYLREVSRFVQHFGKPPEELGEKEIKEYLLHVVRDRKISLSTLKQYYSALRFLYKITLQRDWVVDKIPYPKQTTKLPVILDKEEVQSMFSVTQNIKHKAILMLTYSAGLRMSETAHLAVIGYRQHPHADTRPAGQGRPGSLQPSLACCSGNAQAVLERVSSHVMVIPGTGSG